MRVGGCITARSAGVIGTMSSMIGATVHSPPAEDILYGRRQHDRRAKQRAVFEARQPGSARQPGTKEARDVRSEGFIQGAVDSCGVGGCDRPAVGVARHALLAVDATKVCVHHADFVAGQGGEVVRWSA